MPDDDRGGGAGDAGQVVVLGHPVAGVAPALGVPGQVEAVAEGLGRAAALHGSARGRGRSSGSGIAVSWPSFRAMTRRFVPLPPFYARRRGGETGEPRSRKSFSPQEAKGHREPPTCAGRVSFGVISALADNEIADHLSQIESVQIADGQTTNMLISAIAKVWIASSIMRGQPINSINSY